MTKDSWEIDCQRTRDIKVETDLEISGLVTWTWYSGGGHQIGCSTVLGGNTLHAGKLFHWRFGKFEPVSVGITGDATYDNGTGVYTFSLYATVYVGNVDPIYPWKAEMPIPYYDYDQGQNVVMVHPATVKLAQWEEGPGDGGNAALFQFKAHITLEVSGLAHWLQVWQKDCAHDHASEDWGYPDLGYLIVGPSDPDASENPAAVHLAPANPYDTPEAQPDYVTGQRTTVANNNERTVTDSTAVIFTVDWDITLPTLTNSVGYTPSVTDWYTVDGVDDSSQTSGIYFDEENWGTYYEQPMRHWPGRLIDWIGTPAEDYVLNGAGYDLAIELQQSTQRVTVGQTEIVNTDWAKATSKFTTLSGAVEEALDFDYTDFTCDYYDGQTLIAELEGTDGYFRIRGIYDATTVYGLRTFNSIAPPLKVRCHGHITTLDGQNWSNWPWGDQSSPRCRCLWYGATPDLEYQGGDPVTMTNGQYEASLTLRTTPLFSTGGVNPIWQGLAANHQVNGAEGGIEGAFTLKLNQWHLGLYAETDWLADNELDQSLWRIPVQSSFKMNAFTLVHAATGAIPLADDKWDVTGGSVAYDTPSAGQTQVTGTTDCIYSHVVADETTETYSLREWRYARLRAKGDASCTLPVRFTYQVASGDPDDLTWTEYSKTWDIALTTSLANNVIDLMSPETISFGRSEYDTTDQNNTKTFQTDSRQIGQIEDPEEDGSTMMAFNPGHLYGVPNLKKIELLVPDGRIVTVEYLQGYLAEQVEDTKPVSLSIRPVYQTSEKWEPEDPPVLNTYHVEGKRIAQALVNRHACAELPYAVRNDSRYLWTEPTSIDEVLGWLKEYAGWTVTSERTGQDDDSNTEDLPAYWLAEFRVIDTANPTLQPMYDYDLTTDSSFPKTIEVRVKADIMGCAPGLGGEDNSVNGQIGDYGGEYPLWWYMPYGAAIQGLTHDKDTYLAKPGAQCQVYNGAAKVGDYTADGYSFWRSVVLPAGTFTVKYSGMASPPVIVSQNARDHWASLIGLVPGGGPCDMDYHKPTNQLVAAAVVSGVLNFYRSQDHGRTWASQAVDGVTAASQAAVTVPHNTALHGAFVAAVEDGDLTCRVTGDWGTSWNMVTVQTGVTDKPISMRYNETRGLLSITYAKGGSTYLIESADLGQTWGTPVEIMAEEPGGAICSIPTNALLVYAKVDGDGNLAVTHSGDRGGSWT